MIDQEEINELVWEFYEEDLMDELNEKLAMNVSVPAGKAKVKEEGKHEMD